jgi:predicted dithiol-disulfide oxidoreductase (DUF899 family)
MILKLKLHTLGYAPQRIGQKGLEVQRGFATVASRRMARSLMGWSVWGHNFEKRRFPSDEAPGMSVFHRDSSSEVFHTYSCYARGFGMRNGAYHILDLVPKGRDETNLPFTMSWVGHHDRYED